MRRLTLIVAAALLAAACATNVTDYQVHHYVARVKADSVVDQRNAWCQWSTTPTPAVGQDVADTACAWTNPTKTVHP